MFNFVRALPKLFSFILHSFGSLPRFVLPVIGLFCFFFLILLRIIKYIKINPLNAKLNPICHLLALLGGATIVVVSRLRVNGYISQTTHFGYRFIAQYTSCANCTSYTSVEFKIYFERDVTFT